MFVLEAPVISCHPKAFFLWWIIQAVFSKIVIDQYRPRESNIQQRLCWACEELRFPGSEKFQNKRIQSQCASASGQPLMQVLHPRLRMLSLDYNLAREICAALLGWRGGGLLSLGIQQWAVLGGTEGQLGTSSWGSQLMPTEFWALNVNTRPSTHAFWGGGCNEIILGTMPVCCKKVDRLVHIPFVCANSLALFVKTVRWWAPADHVQCPAAARRYPWDSDTYVRGRTGRNGKSRFSAE